MWRFFFFFTVVALAQAGVAPIARDVEPADMDTILRAVGAPPCMRQCIDPLISNLSSIWEMEDLTKDTDAICRAHEEAISCLQKSQFCDMQGTFPKASSSLRQRCEIQAGMFADAMECIKPNIDTVMQKCDSECSARSNLTAFAKNQNIKLAAAVGGNVFIVTDNLGELCGSLKCLLPCITTEMNSVCKLSGWATLDALMQPLEAVATMIDAMHPSLKDLTMNRIDRRCHFVLDSQTQRKIRKGDLDVFKL